MQATIFGAGPQARVVLYNGPLNCFVVLFKILSQTPHFCCVLGILTLSYRVLQKQAIVFDWSHL